MRVLFPTTSACLFALIAVFTSGCGHSKPPKPPAASAVAPATATPDAAISTNDDGSADDEKPFKLAPRAVGDTVPRVIRRIVSEQKEEVQHLLLLAGDLTDTRGRTRAVNEANELALELSQITAPMDTTDSSGLDQLVTKLLLLDTRIGILHDALRSATSRGTASVIE